MNEGKQGELVDEKRISRKRQRGVNDKNIRSLILRTLMGDANGRRFLWLFLQETNVFSQTVDFGPGGHARTAFAEGKRAIGLRFLHDITALAPAEYLKMTVENTAVDMEIEDGRDTDPDAE